MAEFNERFGADDCRTLTGWDMVADHDAFMEDGSWKTNCTTMIEFVEMDKWEAALRPSNSA